MQRALIVFAFVLPACGQTFTASIRGTISDSTKAAIPSAVVTLTDVDRNLPHSTTTDTSGRYMLPSLQPGSYSLTVEATGFRKHTQPAFALAVQQQATVNVELTVGDVSASVEVQASAPLINTTAATLGQVVENKFILSAPLAARNPLTLVTLAAGLVPAENSAGGSSGINFVANGVRANSSDALLDGMNLTGIDQNGGITEVKYSPSVDLIEEFKVQTNFYNAEFGNSGGAIINMVSKSGTNELHGVGYEFHRNAALNANSFFANRNGQNLPAFKRNVFGGTVGGPVWIPRIYKGKSRTFFFTLFEGDRQSNPSSTLTTVPTAQQLAGDFSDTRRSNGALYPIYNPFDLYTSGNQTLRRPFPGNVIPASLHSRVAKNILAYYPKPTSEGAPFTHVNNFFAQGVRQASGNKIDAKIDHNLGEKQRFSSRYSVNWTSSNPPNLIGNIADRSNQGRNRNQNFVFDSTRTQSPTTVITTRLGILRRRTATDPISRLAGFDQTTLGFPSYLLESGVKQFPDIGPSGYLALGGSSFGQTYAWETEGILNGSVTKIIGGHTIKTGSELRAIHENFYQHGYPTGNFVFGRAQTGENPLVSNANQGDAIASMLLSWGSGGQYGLEWPTATYGKYFGLYLQDDWRVTRHFTLNLGVRYDFDVPRRERFNRLNWFDFEAPSPLQGKVPEFPNLKGVMRFVDDKTRSAFDGDWNNLQPRIGIAYALGGKTSLRAGYGIFYVTSRHTTSGEPGSAFRSRPGIQWSRDGGLTPYATLENPYPAGLTPPWGRDPLAFLGQGLNAYARDDINPQYQQWNFSIQRAVPGNGVVEVNYAGSKGTHLYFGSSGDTMDNRNKLDPVYWDIGRTMLNSQVPNPFLGVITDPRSVLSLPTVQLHRLLRPYPQYAGGVGSPATPNIANSLYHSVQFKYEKRFSRGLAVIAHYTIAKMMSDSDVNNSE